MYLIRIPKNDLEENPKTLFINTEHIILITVTTAKEDNGLESQIWIISLSDGGQIILRDWEQIEAFQKATEGLIGESHSFYHHRLEDEHYNLLEKYRDLKIKTEELEERLETGLYVEAQ